MFPPQLRDITPKYHQCEQIGIDIACSKAMKPLHTGGLDVARFLNSAILAKQRELTEDEAVALWIASWFDENLEKFCHRYSKGG